MKPFARDLPVPEQAEGSVVEGYRVGLSEPRGSEEESVHHALSEYGDPATIVLAHHSPSDRVGGGRFGRLCRIRAALQHPALIAIRSWGELDSMRYVISDPYPEGTLADLLEHAPLAPAEAIRLLAPTAAGLDLAHAGGLQHQALSAESLLYDEERLLLDTFGLAGSGGDPTWKSSLQDGYPHYAAPEAVRGEPLVAASNIYSITAILVHALTGRPPYEGAPESLVYAHLVEPPPRPSEWNDELPPAFDGLVAAGMAKDPDDRPAGAAALLMAAAGLLSVPFPTGAKRLSSAVKPSRAGRPARTPARAATTNGAAAAPKAPRPPLERRLLPQHVLPRSRAAALLAVPAVIVGLGLGLLLAPGGGEPAPPPDRTSVQNARALASLEVQRREQLALLAKAASAPAQQRAGAALAEAYLATAERTSAPGLADAARGAALAYGALATAARLEDGPRYARATELVEGAEERFQAAARSASARP